MSKDYQSGELKDRFILSEEDLFGIIRRITGERRGGWAGERMEGAMGRIGHLAVLGGHCGRYERVLSLYDYESHHYIATGMRHYEQRLRIRRQ